MKTIEDVKRLVAVLTDEQQQLLKDTINKGGWGDGEYEFLRYPAATGNDNTETVWMYGYCTNDAKLAGHFQGRQVSAMFRSIYKNCVLTTTIEQVTSFPIATTGGGMAAEICCLSERSMLMPLNNGQNNKVCWVTPTAGERDSGTLQGNVSTVVQNFGRQCL